MKKRPIIIKEEKEETPPPYELREVGKPSNEVGSLVFSLIKEDLIKSEFEEVVFLYTQNKKVSSPREGQVTIWTSERELLDEKGKAHKVLCSGELVITIAKEIDLDPFELAQKWGDGLRESGLKSVSAPRFVNKFGTCFSSVSLSFEWGERLELRPTFVPIDQETDQETQERRKSLVDFYLS